MLILYYAFPIMSTYFYRFFDVFLLFVKGEQIMYEIFEQLLQKHGLSAYKVAKETGVTQSTLSDWKRGRSTPKTENMKKLADFFGVSVEYLMTGKKSEPLTKRDEKEIGAILSNTEALLRQEGLMFDGVPATPEAIESIISAMQVGMEMGKKRNKELYTPKKYKKDK